MSSCPLYPQFKVQSLLNIWKISYCEGDYEKCERFKLSACGSSVPITLLPNGKSLGPPRG
jgi:hypothetical protein